MQGRIVQMWAAIAAVVLALTVARTEAFARSDHEKCSTTKTDVEKTNPDGTQAVCDASIGPPSKATAHAKHMAEAESDAEDGGVCVSSASGKGANAGCGSSGDSKGTATASGEDAGAQAGGSVSGTTEATAKGMDSGADAFIVGAGGGKATSTATGGGEATAEIPNGGGGDAVATAKDDSEAVAFVNGEGGTASADTSGASSYASAETVGGGASASASDGAEVIAQTDSNCEATASGSGTGGEADAYCETPGSVVTAQATEGSVAEGFDYMAPVCMPKNGGVAKVTSPMGNCP